MDPVTTAAAVKITGEIVDGLGDFIRRRWPDKNEQEKVRAEIAASVEARAASAMDSFRQFVVAYEGSGDNVHPVLQILRGSVRPVLTYALASAYLWVFFHPGTYNAGMVEGLFQLNLISLGFWFGERAVAQITQAVGNVVAARRVGTTPRAAKDVGE